MLNATRTSFVTFAGDRPHLSEQPKLSHWGNSADKPSQAVSMNQAHQPHHQLEAGSGEMAGRRCQSAKEMSRPGKAGERKGHVVVIQRWTAA